MHTVSPQIRIRIRSALLLFVLLSSGCAAITNPVANGVPARLVPEELLAERKANLEPIPLSWLRTEIAKPYRLDTGDILGVYIEGVLPVQDQIPPVHFPDVADVPPSVGFPIPIRDDGTVSLPLVNDVPIAGMTFEEAEQAIKDAYTQEKGEFLLEGQTRILVSLIKGRSIPVYVVREDSPTQQRAQFDDPGFRLFGASNLSLRGTQGSGFRLNLPHDESNVLNALSRTGGLPGPTAANEVIIYRGYTQDEPPNIAVPGDVLPDQRSGRRSDRTDNQPRVIRIPLRVRPNEPRPFSDEDIRLQLNDIVYIPARETDVYYTGGLMPAREVPLPRDYDLTVVEAVLRVGAPVLTGGRFANNFTGGILAIGIGSPNPSLLTVLRKTPEGQQVNIRVDLNRALRDPRENILVKEGDILLLQETPAEAVARYISQTFSLTGVTEAFRRGSFVGTGTVRFP